MKLIFLDIDGTLTLPGHNEPPQSALDVIRRAQAAGHKVFLCSGRNFAMLSPLLKYGFDGVIASAGGYVVVGDDVIFDCPMPEKEAQEALHLLHGEGVFCTIEAKDGTWGDEDIGSFLDSQSGQKGANSEIERWRKALAEDLGIRPMREYDGRPIYKVVVMANDMEQLAPARAALEDRYEFCMQEITDPAHRCINGELIGRAFDKGRAVKRVGEYMGVPIEDSIGFGDSMNDLQMIETVGYSVVMDNGAEGLKKIADMVCPAVDQDGMADAFVKLGLV